MDQENIVISDNADIIKSGHVMTLEEADAGIRNGLKDAARSVIVVGYYLKGVRDNKLYLTAGYMDIWEYASATFGFSKSTASRYMARNDKFSVGGNSPVMAEEYREYSKAQLQEMLSLDAEQMSTVTPDMTVREIRELRRPKEIPYFEIPGQLSLSDFPEIDVEQESDETITQETNQTELSDTASFTVTAEDLIGEMQEESVATSQQMNAADEQQETEGNAAEKQQDIPEKPKTEKCIHDGISRCTLSEEDKEKDGTGEDCAHHCCWNCVKRDGCNIECYASSKRKTLDDDEVAAEDGENAEQPAEPIEFDRKTLEDMIRNAQGALDQMCDYWVENQPYTYARYNMMIQAYKLLLKEHDEYDQKLDPVEQQPELRLLKNDKQRAEFIDAYEEWPLWIDNQETGERYYRYDLPDGASFVVKTYRSMLYDYKAGTGMRYKEGYGRNEQYILEPGKFFRDCSANRSAMIEKLKELQKSEQGGKKDADRIKTENRR